MDRFSISVSGQILTHFDAPAPRAESPVIPWKKRRRRAHFMLYETRHNDVTSLRRQSAPPDRVGPWLAYCHF
jgi:hypothetical protein